MLCNGAFTHVIEVHWYVVCFVDIARVNGRTCSAELNS